jgi:dinuclear metal center YbgI/SA1388 family protein
MEAMEQLAPLRLAEKWDNIGLQIGSPDQDINRVVVALDATEATVEYAVAQGADLLIVHHPFIFQPLHSLRTDRPQGRILYALIKQEIGVYAAHTNLDIAAGGVNDVLAGMLNLEQVEPLTVSQSDRLVKLAVFVPETHSETVRQAITEAGAGHIGKYSHCTFQTAGTGTFLPLAGSNPFLGRPDTLEYAAECRLETIMPEKISKQVIDAMLGAHPYEEVAYDLYPLLNEGVDFGLGRMGKLPAPLRFAEFARMVKAILSAGHVRVCGDLNAEIVKVAVCGGSGSELISHAIAADADVLVTGDIKYHEAQQAVSGGLTLVDAGHFATERPVVQMIADYLKKCATAGNWDLHVMISEQDKDIFHAM